MPLMPAITSLDYYAAELVLLQAGIFVRPGYFQPSQISTSFITTAPFAFAVSGFGKGSFEGTPLPGTVVAQSPDPTSQIAQGAPLSLTLMEFPISVAFP